MLGFRGFWALKGAGLPRVLGSRGFWAPKGAGFQRRMGSRGCWAPEVTGLPRRLGSLGSMCSVFLYGMKFIDMILLNLKNSNSVAVV